MRAQDIEVEFDDDAVGWLAKRGFQPEFGARPLRRVIQREVDNPLSRLLLDGRAQRGQRVRVTVRDDALQFDVVDRADDEANVVQQEEPVSSAQA
jgi:ATP-dependent Clp protease ATP-binding subunit ClpC